MKLIFCPECHDVLKLQGDHRECLCGCSWGQYNQDGLHARIGGDAIPIGIDNNSLAEAVLDRPGSGMGYVFEAFVIPCKCDTIEEE